ncbi:hypothetical protein F8388_006352 [Cannabis sativa]|uniref:peroxidase n=1 Tax=Cannabis sativa TaxID=3483 RepID=A0A7J6EDS1_CANSA|nr:hypothetical protein F8388_006352 [Cannabis sativa]
MSFSHTITGFSLVMILLFKFQSVHSQLQVGYYSNTCNLAEIVVKDEVMKAFYADTGVAAGLLRMHFHDCFVRSGGLGYDVPAGRRDGKVSLASEAVTNLPGPSSNLNQLTQIFASKGFTQQEMVTLSGAHTIGRSHCTSFSSRLYNFNGITGQDPSLDSMYAARLKQQCPQGNRNPSLVVPMNPFSPTVADNSYYSDVLARRGLFSSDQALLSDATTASLVNQFARAPFLWTRMFADAMVKMGQIEVLTGNTGEIRANCSVINT